MKTAPQLDDLRLFCAVARNRSFAATARELGLSNAVVSKRIAILEAGMGTALLHRTTRSVALTEQGETLNRAVREVFAKLAMTEALLTESRERPTGRLK